MRIDWISIAVIIVMGFSVIIGLQYYYNIQDKQCMSNPLVYGARQMSDTYEQEFIGTGYFITDGGQSPVIITFDSNNLTVLYKN